jgi:hypothetical protein
MAVAASKIAVLSRVRLVSARTPARVVGLMMYDDGGWVVVVMLPLAMLSPFGSRATTSSRNRDVH